MIEVENLSKRYGEIFAIRNLSFSVKKGEILGFLGPNGAGKTTTMRIITGYIPPTEGRVIVGGFDVVEEPVAAKRQIGYLPENPPLYNEMSVEGYLSFVAEIRGIERKRKRKAIEETMEKCGVADVRRRLIGNLSRGYRQRVGIAQALVHNPPVLILDEPTVGLDPRQIIDIRELIRGLAGRHTVILSTHLLQEVTMTCTRVVIINEGKIALEESMSRLSRSQEGTGRFFLKLGHTGGDISKKLSSLEGVVSVSEEYPGVFTIETDLSRDIRKDISKTVVLNGWALLEFRPMRITLEDVFLKAISTEGESS